MGRVSNANGFHYGSPNNPVALNKLKKVINKGLQEKGPGKAWKGVACPVCLEIPHNSVLLLCSSYHKGCHPFMCATGSCFSNCLEQYKKAYAKDEKSGTPPELMCPLCRGQVKGWTVVEDARKYLNSRKRSCMKDNCLFSGSYRQLKKHVKAVHPRVNPRAVDPVMEAKWKKLEVERERRDVITTVMSSTPGAVVFGDYVIEPYNNDNHYDNIDDDLGSEDSLEGRFFDWRLLGGRRGLLTAYDVRQRSAPAILSRGVHSILRNRWVRNRGGSRRRQTRD